MTYGKQTDKKTKITQKHNVESQKQACGNTHRLRHEAAITEGYVRSGGMGGAWAVCVCFFFSFFDLARGIICMQRVNVVQKPTPAHLFL